jgi:hypothetical protein
MVSYVLLISAAVFASSYDLSPTGKYIATVRAHNNFVKGLNYWKSKH